MSGLEEFSGDLDESAEEMHARLLAKRIEDSEIYNQGIYAAEAGDYWEAMQHFNRCLLGNPDPPFKFLCFYNLAASIEGQFNFYMKGGGETGTDHEVAWSIRRAVCGEQACKTYEYWELSDEDLEGLEELYEQAKDLCNGAFTWGMTKQLPNGELSERDFSAVRKAKFELDLDAIRSFEDEYFTKEPSEYLAEAQAAVDVGDHRDGISLFERLIVRPPNIGLQYLAAYGAVEAYSKIVDSGDSSPLMVGTVDNKKLRLFLDLAIDLFPDMPEDIQAKLPIPMLSALRRAV